MAEHGTAARYRKGCRLGCCKVAWRLYHARYRAGERTTVPTGPLRGDILRAGLEPADLVRAAGITRGQLATIMAERHARTYRSTAEAIRVVLARTDDTGEI